MRSADPGDKMMARSGRTGEEKGRISPTSSIALSLGWIFTNLCSGIKLKIAWLGYHWVKIEKCV
jgi:hypothetical protein